MLTQRRLEGLQKWLYENLCKGRKLKAPAEDGDLKVFEWVEPQVFIDYYPTEPTADGGMDYVAPSILIMQHPSRIKFTEEERFDRYAGIHRPQEFGQSLAVTLLFSVYEQGTRLQGFIPKLRQGEFDPDLLRESTREGLFTLTGWMDEAMRKMLALGHIPGTDLIINRKLEDGSYGLYSDSHYVVDKRPSYLGMINMEFTCFAEEVPYGEILDCLL